MKHIILDTDPGVDDALAFLLTFSSPEIRVEAITTVNGNVSEDKCHRNAKKLLEFLDRIDVPVASGAKNPLLRKRGGAEEFHGKTGLMDAVLPEPKMPTDIRTAPGLIIDLSHELGKELTLVAIGPLTNIATAIIADPTIPQRVGGLVIMGGAFNLTPYGRGNANPVAEFNIWHDPEAAKIVFNSGIPTVCAGLDTTTHPSYRMSLEMFAEVESLKTRRARLVVSLCKTLCQKYDGLSLHDPMALAFVIDPTIFQTARYKVDVETRGELTDGMTVVDKRRSSKLVNEKAYHEVIIEVDASRFHRMIRERVFRGD